MRRMSTSYTKKELKPWRLEFFDLKLFGKTGSFDALNKVFLSKEEDDEEREYHEDRRRIVKGLLLNKLGNAFGNVANGVRKDYHVGHKHVVIRRIRPLPGEGEEEDGDHHVSSVGEHNREEGTHGACAVDIRCFVESLRQTSEVLTHEVDIKTVLKTETGSSHNNHGPNGVDDRHVADEVSETNVQRKHDGLRGNDKGKDYEEEEKVFAFEVESSKTVTGNAGYENLENSGYKGENCGVDQSFPVLDILYRALEEISGAFTGDKHNGFIFEVGGGHEGNYRLYEEGIENHERDTDNDDETSDGPDKTAYAFSVKVFLLPSFPAEISIFTGIDFCEEFFDKISFIVFVTLNNIVNLSH